MARAWFLPLSTLLAAGCAAAVARPATPAAPAATSPAAAAAASTVRSHTAWADSVLATLSVRQKAAQMVWVWTLGDYTATDAPQYAAIEKQVTELELGGIIVSVGGPMDIATKVNALQRASKLPLLVSADLETGAAFRARGGWFLPNAIELGGATSFPYQMGIGATRDPKLAYEMGRVTAEEGRAMGIHMAFAPVLDVNNNPKNPVISARSFGEDAKLVSEMGIALVKGIQEHGMLATGKHFPGHGDTEQNSHLELSRVNVPRARLDSVELKPFQAAIDAGYDLDRVLTTDDLVASDNCFFAATGITDGELLKGVQYGQNVCTTESLVMRSLSGTVRLVQGRHRLAKANTIAG